MYGEDVGGNSSLERRWNLRVTNPSVAEKVRRMFTKRLKASLRPLLDVVSILGIWGGLLSAPLAEARSSSLYARRLAFTIFLT